MDKSFNLIVQTDEKSLSKTDGQFTIEPLSRGYGITLGNAMRRVLLTSIPGAAITHLQIEGVDHEFSTLKGVKDDVADIIMNLKKVRFKLMDNNPDKINLTFKGKNGNKEFLIFAKKTLFLSSFIKLNESTGNEYKISTASILNFLLSFIEFNSIVCILF